MSAALDLILRLTDNASPGLSRVRGELGGLEQSAGGAGRGFGVLQGAASFVIGGAISAGISAITGSIGGLVSGMVAGNAQFEQYKTQFTVLLGSVDAAKERLADLAAFGASTPFELPQVVEANKILQGFGLQAEDTAARFGYSGQEIMTIAGDVASGTGSSFQEMSLLLGKFSAGATGEAIARMQELGITTRDELAQMGLEFSNSGQLLSPLPEAMNVVLGLMEDKYGGMMQAQSVTFNGMLSNLSDWKDGTLRLLGEPIFEILKDKLTNVLAFLGSPAVQAAISNFATILADGIGVAVDWINNTLLPAIQEFFTWLIGTGIPQFQAFIDPILAVVLPALMQLGEWFTGVLPGVISAVTQFVSWKDILILLGGIVLSVVLPAIASLVAGILAVAAPIVAAIAIIALLRTAWENDWGGIQGKVQAVIDFIVPFVQNAIQFIKDWWSANGDEVLLKAQQIWDSIQTAVSTAIAIIQTVITTVVSAIKTFWAQNGDEILAKASEIWQAIQTAIETAINTVQTILTTVVTAIQTFWAEHGDTILAKAEEIWTAIQTAIETAINFVSEIFAAFKAAFEGDWTTFGENLRDAWDIAWDAIATILETAWDTLTSAVSSLITNIVDTFSSTDWGALGQSIIDGLVSSIGSGAGAVADAVAAAAQAAWDAWAGFWDSSSPSQRAIEDAQNVTAGWGIGMQRGKPVVAQSALDVGRAVAENMMGMFGAVNLGNTRTGNGSLLGIGNNFRGEQLRPIQAFAGGVGNIIPNYTAVSRADPGTTITIQVDARGNNDPRAIEEAGYRGAKRALQEAGYRADVMRRVR